MNEAEKNCYVYFHINPIVQEVFYVGIGNLERPFLKSGRNKYWKDYVKLINENYNVIIIHKNITWREAGAIEKQLIAQIGRKDKELGTLLNRSNGGEGNQNTNKWSEEELIIEALKYNKRSEFFNKNRGAYKSAARRGILDKICPHMISYPGKNNFKLTKENCLKIALQFNRKTDLMDAKKSIYNAIIRNHWTNDCFAHMKKIINKEHCKNVAISFNTLTELMKKNKYVYKLIIKNNWQEELFSHMVKSSQVLAIN